MRDHRTFADGGAFEKLAIRVTHQPLQKAVCVRPSWHTRRLPLEELPDTPVFDDPAQRELRRCTGPACRRTASCCTYFIMRTCPPGIAAVLHISQNAVTTRLTRAREALRRARIRRIERWSLKLCINRPCPGALPGPAWRWRQPAPRRRFGWVICFAAPLLLAAGVLARVEFTNLHNTPPPQLCPDAVGGYALHYTLTTHPLDTLGEAVLTLAAEERQPAFQRMRTPDHYSFSQMVMTLGNSVVNSLQTILKNEVFTDAADSLGCR